MPTIKKEEEEEEQQPKRPAVVGASDLDNLQSMLNMVLLTSGRFIKEHQSGGGTGRMKVAMRQSVPVASERFHDALDELENEVRLAQVVLRRDRALLKQDRKKREIAAKEKEAEKARLAAESRNVGSVIKKEVVKVEKPVIPTQPEGHMATEPEKQSVSPKALHREVEKVIPPPIEIASAPGPERDPLFDGTPTTANPNDTDLDFDAMFGDAMDTSGDSNNDVLGDMMDTSGDTNFDFDAPPPLLRGLEDFAKGDDANDTAPLDIDMAMADSTGLDTAANGAPAQPAQIEQPVPVNEPAKLDLSADSANNDELMGDMMTDTFDDLFNVDEYENPENQAFDDAFFNFE
ncbi:hypothetical protein GQ44DRAFT_711476 [Phaeosphaeriaceae sp. PMI808]|nr:hypothetical protein GQ44DRAFT_711476 [Phaeosphaeriaceae sp. PMI808]